MVLPTYDLALTLEPAAVTAVAGTTVTLAVRTVSGGGYTGLTSLTLDALPEGVTGALSSATLGPNQVGTLTLITTASAPSSVPIILRGTSVLPTGAVVRTASATLTVEPPGQTVLVGQVRDEDDQPLPNVTIKLSGSTLTTLGVTDAGGNFQVTVPVAGTQTILIDGSTASTASARYPTIPLTVTLQPGTVTSLPFVPRLHRQQTTGAVDISTTSVQRVVTPPDLPGFTMTIPAGVTILGWDGQPNTQVSIRKVPLDRSPLPPFPADRVAGSLYMYYFGKVGGGTPSQPVPIAAPNELDLPPGTQVELWYYDEAPDGSRPNAWAQYGTGTVSADGSQVVPDLNPATGQPYGQPRFCCGGWLYALMLQAKKAIDDLRGGTNLPAGKTGPSAGEPVDLASGLFVLEKTDLVLPGRLPIVFTRLYRPRGAAAGPFGPGTSHPYHVLLLVEGDLRTLVLPGGARLAFPKQADGTFRNSTDPRMRGAVLTETGGLATLRGKDGTTWTFGAPAFGTAFLVEQQDRQGNRLRLTRTGTAQTLMSVQDRTGRELTFTYDGSNRITSVTDPLGRRVIYTYNAAEYLETVTDPAGGVTRYTYDTNGRMRTITDARGITFLTTEYDANGRVSRQTQADGGVWTFAYTVTGGVITQTVVTDPRGSATTSRFNSMSYLIAQTDAMGQTTSYTRDPSSNLLRSTTDPLGRVTTFTYDANGNLLTITDPLQNARTFTYDATFNTVTSSTDALGNRTTFEYDVKGNLTAITDPEQNLRPEAERLKTTFTYNAFGQPLTTTDPVGNPTTFTYDDVGNLTSVQDPLGNTTTRSYDSVSRLIAQTDPLGKTTRFSYDLLNQLVQLQDPLNGRTTFGYDPNGNLLTVTDARGNTLTHEYDVMDHLSRRVDPLGKEETFSYDGMGNLTGTTDRKHQATTFTSDALDRRIRTEYADGAVATFQYDAGGRLLVADDTQDPHRPITLAYDPLDRLLSETTTRGTVSYAYDTLGRRTQMLVGGQTPVAYAYDANSRLTGLTQADQAVTLGYDAANRRTLLTLPNAVSTEYQYDLASRLTALIYRNALGNLGDLQYIYDANGNRTAIGGSFARSLLPEAVPAAAYDAANRQLTFGSTSLTFDDTGNLASLTSGGQTSMYSWDTRNRLTAISGPSLGASFAYDALGRRAVKTLNGQTTRFQYDGLDATAEDGPTGLVAYLRGLAIDETLTRTDSTGTTAFLADALGSSVGLADSTGALTTAYTYAPFGDTAASGTPSANPFQFTGRENDGTGLYYFRARYYDPLRSRFVSEDPAGRIGENNLFAYVRNAPLSYIDSLGLVPLTYHEMKVLVAEHNRSSLRDEIILVQAWMESKFDPQAVPPTDPATGQPQSTARGLLQVTKRAADEVGANHGDLFLPGVNIDTGSSYLRNRLEVVKKRRADLTKEEEQIRRALEIYRGPHQERYADSILQGAACLKARVKDPMKCLTSIRK